MHAGDGVGAMVVLVRDDVEVVIGRVVAPRADLGLVDTVANLGLAARRLGGSIRLRGACPDLCRLLIFLGLDEGAGLVLEPRGEAEGGKELGVEEVVEPGDPPL